MKVIIFIAAMAAMTLVSCSENEEIDQSSSNNAIGFGTYTTGLRASVVDMPRLQQYGFVVNGYSTGVNDIDNTATSNFMNQVAVTYSGGSWSYSPSLNWPGLIGSTYGKVSFYAWSPSNPTYVVSSTGIPTLTVHVYDSTFGMNDLVVSKQENRDAQWAAENNNVVTFTFGHIFSKIGFTASKASTSEIVVDSATYSFDLTHTNAIYSDGVYSFQTNGWSSLSGFHGNDNLTDHYGLATTPTTLTSTAQIINDTDRYLFFIPQQVSAGALFVHIYYTVDGAPFDKVVTIPTTLWQIGKQYTYNFIIGDTSITFDTTVVSTWEN